MGREQAFDGGACVGETIFVYNSILSDARHVTITHAKRHKICGSEGIFMIVVRRLALGEGRHPSYAMEDLTQNGDYALLRNTSRSERERILCYERPSLRQVAVIRLGAHLRLLGSSELWVGVISSL